MMSERGLTLLEMLVTLVIASMALGLLMLMLDQGRRLELRLQRNDEVVTTGLWRMALLRDAVEGMLPGADGESGSFEGDATAFACSSLSAPGALGRTAKVMRVTLNVQSGEQHLRIELDPPSEGLVVARWPARGGHFAYLDHQGEVHARWPPERPLTFRALPKAVFVRQDQRGHATVHVLPLAASPVSPPTRRQLEQI